MGLVTSKVVQPAPADMPEPNCGQNENRSRPPGKNQKSSRSKSKASTSASATRPAKPTGRQAQTTSVPSKKILFTAMSPPPPPPSGRKPKVWTVTREGQGDKDFHFPTDYKPRRRDFGDSIVELNELSDEFADIELVVAKTDDESSRRNLRKFVLAWRSALSAFTYTKFTKRKTDIPVAATSYCKEGISRWQRCGRFCISCLSESAAEHMEEDLTRKHSIQKFYTALDEMDTISGHSVNIAERRIDSYDLFDPLGQNKKVSELFILDENGCIEQPHHQESLDSPSSNILRSGSVHSLRGLASHSRENTFALSNSSLY